MSRGRMEDGDLHQKKIREKFSLFMRKKEIKRVHNYYIVQNNMNCTKHQKIFKRCEYEVKKIPRSNYENALDVGPLPGALTTNNRDFILFIT